tara:strand:- start:2969 stop:3223 length:255 start_codon:yes stop_codon:yes gene_type:complete
MKHCVYLIITYRKDKYISYVGYTNNLLKRIEAHNNSKGAKFTKGNFWFLAYFKYYKTKNIALQHEYKLKNNYTFRNYIKKKFLN